MTKSKLSKSDVKHVGRLAQLELSEKEVKKFQKQLSDILGYIAKLQELDTDSVEPTCQTTGLENVFRSDKVLPSLTQQQSLSGAKSKLRGYFKTKAIFEET